jgi:hypothetical protein
LQTIAAELRDESGSASLSEPRARGGVPRHAPFVTEAGSHKRARLFIDKFYAVMFLDIWLLAITGRRDFKLKYFCVCYTSVCPKVSGLSLNKQQ